MNALDVTEGPFVVVPLEDVLPARAFRDERYGRIPGYLEWEREVGEPELRKKGWAILSWGAEDEGEEFPRFALCEIRNRLWRLVYAP